MYPTDTESDILELLTSISENGPNSMNKVNVIVNDISKICEMATSKIRLAFWKAAKMDNSSTLRVLGAAINWLPVFPCLPVNRMISLAYKSKANVVFDGLAKVMLVLLLIGNSHGLKVEQTDSRLIISSQIKDSELIATTETFILSPINIFQTELEMAINHSKILNTYRLSSKVCEHESQDDILNITKILKSGNFNKIRVNSFEKYEKKNFVVALFKDQKFIPHCVLDFSTEFEKKLLSINPYRRSISSQLEADNYFAFMQTYYQDELQRSCVRHGKIYYDEEYRVSFKTEAPGIERCSLSCKSQSDRHLLAKKQSDLHANACLPQNVRGLNFSCFDYGSTVELPCQMWSYDVQNQRCYFLSKVKDTTFSNLYKWYAYKGAMSGLVNCQPKKINNVFVSLNSQVINAGDICLFSNERFDDVPLYSRCHNRYLEISRPLHSLYQQLLYFKNDFVTIYNFSRPKRSVGMLVFKILKEVASRHGINVVKKLVTGLGLSSRQMLNLAKTTLHDNGFKTTLVKKPFASRNLTFNFTQVAIYFDKLNDLTLHGRIAKIKSQIEDLSSEFLHLKSYFLDLITNANPLLTITQKLVQNSTYLFSSYLTENKIIRHFFVSKEKHSVASKFMTIIPTDLKDFDNLAFYQQGIFSEQSSSSCVTSILQGKDLSKLVQDRVCEKSVGIETISGNIVVFNHTDGKNLLKIFSVKNEALIEVYCPNQTSLWSSTELIVFVTGIGCSVFVNKLPVHTRAQVTFSMADILFQKNISSFTFLEQDWVIFCVILVCSTLAAIGGALCWVKNFKLNPHYNVEINESESPEHEKIIFKRLGKSDG